MKNKEKLLTLLAELQLLEDRLKESEVKTAAQTIYAPPSVLIYGKLKSNMSKKTAVQKIVEGAKLTRAMKSLAFLAESSVHDTLFDLDTQLQRVQNKADTTALYDVFESMLGAFADLHMELCIDAFGQGRLHQTLGDKKLTSYAKFSSGKLPQLHNHVAVNFKESDAVLTGLKVAIVAVLNEDAEVGRVIDSHRQSLVDLMVRAGLEFYAFGNLFQLKRDGVTHVSWQVSNAFSDDCLPCRELQANDTHYMLDTIWTTAKEKGARFLNQSNGCTCAFVPRKFTY